MPKDKAAQLTNADLCRMVADTGYPSTPSAIRTARWRIDKAEHASANTTARANTQHG